MKIPDSQKEFVEQKNKRILKMFFAMATCFGIVLLSMLTVTLHIRKVTVAYYLIYIVFGSLGFSLSHKRIPSAVLSLYMLACFEIVLLFLMYFTSFANVMVVFLGISFVFIIFLDINPIVFSLFIFITFAFESFNANADGAFFSVPGNDSLVKNLTLLFCVMIFLVFWKRHHVVEEFLRDDELLGQRQKTESLLQNIFPPKIIEQLKSQGKVPSESYDNVTVLFSDIVNFTKTSSGLAPEMLINELNDIFTEFDRIVEKYGCVRIKTVGDAYMAVSGIPEQDERHAEKLIICAREFLRYLEQRNKVSSIPWNIRIGIDSGSVITGVVGYKKYIYDIFGSTVDGAIEIESSCQPMHIAISRNTYELVKGKIDISESGNIDLQEEKSYE